MILLNARELSKGFAGRVLFRGLSFGIHQGDRIGLVGPNGAGKSTLLKILCQETSADSGEVVIRTGLRIGHLAQDPVFEADETILSSLMRMDPEHERIPLLYELLSRMDLVQFGEEFKVSELSGGWKKRLALARELMKEPDLLFLDEPTNHLDVHGVLWLEEFIQSTSLSIVTVTHDRLFLQRVASRIFDLDPRNHNGLTVVDGGYLEYLTYKQEQTQAFQRKEQKLRNTWERELEWLRRGPIARLKKQQARINEAHELKDTVDQLEQLNLKKSVGIEFSEAQRSPKKLIELENVSKAYGDRVLFEDFDFIVGQKARIALLGVNGSGKSTLIKIMLGLEKPDSGKVQMTDKVDVAYFEQGRDQLDMKKSVRENLSDSGDYVFFQGRHIHVGSYLDRFLFNGEKANLPVHRLSGGERARLRIAQLMLKPAQLLILDEPTNDLDADTLDILQEALEEFPGAVLLVSHDRYFMDAVSDKILALPEPDSMDRKIIAFADYFQWENHLKTDQSKAREKGKARKEQAAAAAAHPPKVRMTNKEKFEFEQMEASIQDLEKELEEKTSLLQNSEIISDHVKLSELNERIKTLETTIAQKYERWAELEKKQPR